MISVARFTGLAPIDRMIHEGMEKGLKGSGLV